MDEAIELQWYWPTREGLPDLSAGQILLARNLLVRFHRPALQRGVLVFEIEVLVSQVRALPNGSPMLLSGSFSKTAHAILAPDLFRLKPPPGVAPATMSVKSSAQGVKDDVWVVEPSPEEVAYVRQLADWARRNSSTVDSARAKTAATAVSREETSNGSAPAVKVLPAAAGRPLLHVRDVEEGKFCDLLGMVRTLAGVRQVHKLTTGTTGHEDPYAGQARDRSVESGGIALLDRLHATCTSARVSRPFPSRSTRAPCPPDFSLRFDIGSPRRFDGRAYRRGQARQARLGPKRPRQAQPGRRTRRDRRRGDESKVPDEGER